MRGEGGGCCSPWLPRVGAVHLGLSGSLLWSAGWTLSQLQEPRSLRKERPSSVARLAGRDAPGPVWLPGIRGNRVEPGPQLRPSGLGNGP